MKSRFLATALLFFSFQLCVASDWTRFRGPNGSGISQEPVPTTWSESENMLWKAPVAGPGASSPIVVGGKVFVTSYSGYGEAGGSLNDLVRYIQCFDAESGEKLWERSVPAKLPEDNFSGFLREHGYATNTPVSDGEHVYVFFGKSGLYCYDLEGNEIWYKHLGSNSTRKRWGSASSPILYKDLVIVNASEEALTVFALDKKTGDEKWKAEGSGLVNAYSTPVIFPAEGGEREDLVVTMPDEVWGLNPETGKLRWLAIHGLGGNLAPGLTFAGDTVFIFGGFPRTARVAIKVDRKGEIPDENVLWDETSASYVPTPIVHGEHLYWINDQGFAMCCRQSDGEVIYKERLDAQAPGARGKPFYASTLLIGDKLFAVSRYGGAFVVEANPEFKLVAHNKIAGDDSTFNGTPAVADGSLFLRSDKFLYRIGSNK
ncbi:MAG: PQQ-binding-like beta-propeller repeat protein [Verrucomicrobiota bacterium]